MADENTPAEGEQNDEQADEKSGEPQASESPKPTDVPPEIKRALSKANKEAEALRLKLREFEDRDKTEAQKLADRAEAAEKRAVDLEMRALRLEVASEKGLTAAQARRLVGETREELEVDAAELLESFRPAEEKPITVPSLDLGPRSSGVGTLSNPHAADLAQIEADLASTKRR